ncbi:hypothetical protein RhiLY_11428 [Ceratobasidium sp. AG-Ba]|nr:hypothetical protein RhiLY_11428 [Ceratobasidium sp. AG-Ba]
MFDSPELLADPRTDHSVYALDPLQTPELMVGRGLLTWLLAESGRVVGTLRDDYVDGEEMEVLEIRLSLTPTVAVSRAQHANSLQSISHPTPSMAAAHLSPPSTPAGQTQTSRSSTRIRIKRTTRAQEKAAAAAAAPPAPKRRGPRKGPPNAPVTTQAAPALDLTASTSPAPETPAAGPSASSRPQSRVHSHTEPVPVSASTANFVWFQFNLHLSATLTAQSFFIPSACSSQAHSPGKSLARLLLAASSSSSNSNYSSGVGTPMFDSLVERLKTAGLLGQGGADQSTPTDAQKQAILSFIGRMSETSERRIKSEAGDGPQGQEETDQTKASTPSPAFTSIRSPPVDPSPSSAPSPAVMSAPSPAMLAAPSPAAFATPIPPPDSALGTRKREPEDQSASTDPKRVRLGVGHGEARTSSLGDLDSHLSKGLKLEDGGYVPLSDVSPSSSVASPAFSGTAPSFTAPSPNLSVQSAPSPNLSVISPSISAASPYALPHSVSAPPPPSVSPNTSASQPKVRPSSQLGASTQPASSSQPHSRTNHSQRSISQPNLFSNDKQPPKPRKRASRQTPLHAQTDLPEVMGPFITPRDRIGLPRVPAPPSPAKCVAGPGRSKGDGNKKDKGKQSNPEPDKKRVQEKARGVRGVSEEEVRVMLADGYYPPAGLGMEHRKLFGAKNVSVAEGDDADSDVVEVVPTPLSTAPESNKSYHITASSSKYYRSSDYEPLPQVQTQKPISTSSKKAPPIPKRSPVAPPPVRRLPMMMTSPIRATGGRVSDPEDEKSRKGKTQKAKAARPPPEPAPAKVAAPPEQQSLSLSEFSPLKRLLKSAGVNSLSEILGQAGVLGLKGDGGWVKDAAGGRAGAKAAMIKEQEREIVDLTSDAEEEDVSTPVKAPVLVGKPTTPNRSGPQTPTRRSGPSATPSVAYRTQFTTPRKASTKVVTPPRPARTSPVARTESPLFVPAPTPPNGSAYTQGLSSEGVSIPQDLPPSSPPPMSDSDLDAGSGAEGDGKDAYRETARYTDAESSEGGFGPGNGNLDGSDVERRADTDVDDDNEAGDEWNETIRPVESNTESEPPIDLGNFLSEGGFGETGDTELDLDTFANFISMLDGQAIAEIHGEPDLAQFSAELDAVLGQQPLSDPIEAVPDPALLDFAWLDALGSSETGKMLSEAGEVITNPISSEGELASQDISEILAALGAG